MNEIKDYSQLIAELTIELKRINESLKSDRVHTWLNKAGYESIQQTPEPVIEKLLEKVKKQPTQRRQKKKNESSPDDKGTF